MDLPDDGLVLVLKEDCPTCRLIAPVAADLMRRGDLKAVYSQDDPAFPAGWPYATTAGWKHPSR